MFNEKIQNKILFKDVTEIIQSGQRIGIVGPNGCREDDNVKYFKSR